MARPVETLSLFQAKICDFPYPILDLTQNLISHLKPTKTASVCVDICQGLQISDIVRKLTSQGKIVMKSSLF